MLRGDDCAPEQAHSLAFVIGVAVARLLSEAAGLAPSLKWPNDVFLDNRKVAGVLIETVQVDREPVAIAGVGLNVNGRPEGAGLTVSPVSMREVTGERWDMPEIERRLRQTIRLVRDATAAAGWQWLLEEWRRLDATEGGRYLVPVAGEIVPCRAVGIGPDGALLVRSGDKVWSTFAATAQG